MFISSDIFLKGMPHWGFGHPKDIHSGDLCYAMTEDGKGVCSNCCLNNSSDHNIVNCQTEFSRNPYLQASIDAFREFHPEYFVWLYLLKPSLRLCLFYPIGNLPETFVGLSTQTAKPLKHAVVVLYAWRTESVASILGATLTLRLLKQHF